MRGREEVPALPGAPAAAEVRAPSAAQALLAPTAALPVPPALLTISARPVDRARPVALALQVVPARPVDRALGVAPAPLAAHVRPAARAPVMARAPVPVPAGRVVREVPTGRTVRAARVPRERVAPGRTGTVATAPNGPGSAAPAVRSTMPKSA